MFSPEKLQKLVQAIPAQRYWVGLSGGLDSVVLLHALAHSGLRGQIDALHVNHGLHANAAAWQQHCQQLCTQWQIPLTMIALQLQVPKGASLEAYAREQRYQAISQQLNAQDVFLTAHHQDDQAETLLLQLLRGSGVAGLASMPALKSLGAGQLLRPLLAFSRAELADYAREHALTWVEDDSNANLQINRNFLRQKILPLLKQRWPEANKTLARSARQCAKADIILQEIAEQDFQAGHLPRSLAISALVNLSVIKQENVLRHWLRNLNLPALSDLHISQIRQQVVSARIDAQPIFKINEIEIRRFQDDLVAFIAENHATDGYLKRWNGETKINLPRGYLNLHFQAKANCQHLRIPDLNDVDKLCIHYRQGGERFHPEQRRHSHPLKKIMQEWRIPPWQRDQIPLLSWGNELACVAGYAVAKNFSPKFCQTGKDIFVEYVSES